MAGCVRSHQRTLDVESYKLILPDASRAKSMAQTIKDIARLAGVSTATVSRVINGFEKVSNETRSRILAVISQSDYRPNAHAIELVREKREHSDHRPMSGGSESKDPARLDLKSRRAKSQIHHKRLHLLKRENTELRNLVENLYEQILKWQARVEEQATDDRVQQVPNGF